MKYNEILKKYTEEYKKYVELGLSSEDALTLVEKHLMSETREARITPYEIYNCLAGDILWNDTFSALDNELEALKAGVVELLSKTDAVCDESVKKEKTPCKCEETPCKRDCQCVKEVIADTPNHREFRVTYPNGYYTYKMLKK